MKRRVAELAHREAHDRLERFEDTPSFAGGRDELRDPLGDPEALGDLFDIEHARKVTLVVLYDQRHTTVGRAIFSQLVVLLAINLTLPLVIANIAWEAHVGGLLAGGAVAFAWSRLPVSGRQAVPRQVSVALAVIVVCLGALFFG